jgi:hypothetical protein
MYRVLRLIGEICIREEVTWKVLLKRELRMCTLMSVDREGRLWTRERMTCVREQF